MPKKYVHFIFSFLFLTALTGVWMRMFPFATIVQKVPFNHILHAHSHIAILGWTFLAVILLYAFIMWDHLPNRKHAKVIIFTTSIVTFFMFFAFLYEGYGRYSIVLSMIHITIEYWVILFIILTINRHPSLPMIGRFFIRTASVMLAISTIGPLSLGVIAAKGLRDSHLFDMAIYFYLHFQYNGWLYFMLIGFLIIFLSQHHILLTDKLIRISFYLYVFALFPSFILSILSYDIGSTLYIVGIIGAIGQFSAILFLIYELWCKRKIIYHTFDHLFNCLLTISLTILLVKSVMELGLILPLFHSIVYDSRNVIIGYLHLTLLGFISLFIFALFHLNRFIDVDRQLYQFGVYTFLIGLCLNEVVLFTAALLEWMHVGEFPVQNSLLFIASTIMFLSICFIWISTKKHKTISQATTISYK